MNGSGILNHFIPLISWISQFALYLLQTILLLRINSSTQLVVFCSWCVEVERWQAIPDAIKKLQNACILSAYHQVYKRSKKKKKTKIKSRCHCSCSWNLLICSSAVVNSVRAFIYAWNGEWPWIGTQRTKITRFAQFARQLWYEVKFGPLYS